MKLNTSYNPKQLELELRDAIAQVVQACPSAVNRHKVSVAKMTRPAFAHNYEREEWTSQGHFALELDGLRLATIQCKPKASVKIIHQSYDNHYLQKILERTLDWYFPEIEVKL